jgi:UDPglucose 6-dehydrogenase
MDIGIIGCGYVGLVTAAVFADLGNNVLCADVDEERIKILLSGGCPIYEPGLPEMIDRNRNENRLDFSTSTSSCTQRSEIIFICVGTPSGNNGKTDLSQVEAAAQSIAEALDGPKIIVNKSTVPVGTGDRVKHVIDANRKNGEPFEVVSNPEFLREGQAVRDTLQPDRIVIGATSLDAAAKLYELYRPLECPIIVTGIESAEIIKYASNAFLATKISFINSIADLCEKVGADVKAVAQGIGADSRIGSSFLEPGLGYGGSCFPKDVESLLHTSDELGAPFPLLQEVMQINAERVPQFVNRIVERITENGTRSPTDMILAILGLSFKPETDDMREAKSIEMCRLLREKGARLRAYDPIATENAKTMIGTRGIEYCNSAYEAAEGADAAVIVTEWREFKQLNLKRLRSILRQPILFDGRNIYTFEQIRAAIIEYHGIGRPVIYETED